MFVFVSPFTSCSVLLWDHLCQSAQHLFSDLGSIFYRPACMRVCVVFHDRGNANERTLSFARTPVLPHVTSFYSVFFFFVSVTLRSAIQPVSTHETEDDIRIFRSTPTVRHVIRACFAAQRNTGDVPAAYVERMR